VPVLQSGRQSAVDGSIVKQRLPLGQVLVEMYESEGVQVGTQIPAALVAFAQE
jgi:hypothetical protein